MKMIDQICSHPVWVEQMEQIRQLEQDRIFCKHDITHLLDVARLAYIEKLEKNVNISREIIYAAAFLHDIGRGRQYAAGIPHEKAGAELAQQILADCQVTEWEKKEILSAVTEHRCSETGEDGQLSGMIYRADKASRMCLFCPAQKECNWSDEKKNLVVKG